MKDLLIAKVKEHKVLYDIYSHGYREPCIQNPTNRLGRSWERSTNTWIL